MKTTTRSIQFLCVLVLAGALVPNLVRGQTPAFTGHYPNGAEGIKAGSLPPPGFYIRDYNIFYKADRFPDGPPGFDLFGYANAARAIWISDYKILGGFYGADILVPFGYADVEFAGTSDDSFHFGDIHVEPITLSWHPKKWDLAVGYAFWAPTGDFDTDRPSRFLAKGFWSHMMTAGATWYADEAKTWAVSVLNRYEIHMEHEDFDITPGDTYTLEWGLSKTVGRGVDVGVVGYWQQQTTTDSGSGASDEKDRILGIGPEIAGVIPRIGVIGALRYIFEFDANDRPEGNLVTLTLTKGF